mgnify:CR=1 FL=1
MAYAGIFLADLDIYYNIIHSEEIERLKILLTEKVDFNVLISQLDLANATKEKNLERIIARMLLGKTLGIDLLHKPENLQFNKYFQLQSYPQIQCSLSHHKQFMACCLTSKKNTFIGIDIEPSTRTVHNESKRLFAHPKDKGVDSMLLKLWVKKEAAFKAIFHWQVQTSAEKKIRGLHQIAVVDNEFFFEEDAMTCQGNFTNLCGTNFICYLAVIVIQISH